MPGNVKKGKTYFDQLQVSGKMGELKFNQQKSPYRILSARALYIRISV